MNTTGTRLLARAGLLVSISLGMSVVGCGGEPAPSDSGAPVVASSTSYDDLVALFEEWREFESPPLADGVPDYTAASMAAQRDGLVEMRARLDAIDASGWPVAQQVDHHIVRAEMNGLDFDHRVRRPWERDPSFYATVFASRSDVPAHEGPVAHGFIDLWTYDYPLSDADAAELAERIGRVPAFLEQARGNLTGNARDLWAGGVRAMASQSRTLASFAERVAGASDDLTAAIEAARSATDELHAWLESELGSKTGTSGVGKDNYTWYLQHVHLVPYTWDQAVTMMRHDLYRSHAALRLTEHRNRDLPQLPVIADEAEYDRRLNDAVTEFIAFLRDAEIVTIQDDMDAALRARIGSYSAPGPDGLRGFFGEVNYRDPVAMRTHGYHWLELANLDNRPHASPIRRVPQLFNIFDARSEGLATGMEEWSMHAGLFDERPRAREIIYIMLAQRAARAVAGLMMHGLEYDLAEAAAFAARWTPRGWMPPDSSTVIGEQHLYLSQPGYGISYLVGKTEIEKLMSERAIALGDDFTIKGFMDEFTAAGIIPVSLVRWELTGDDTEIRVMTAME